MKSAVLGRFVHVTEGVDALTYEGSMGERQDGYDLVNRGRSYQKGV